MQPATSSRDKILLWSVRSCAMISAGVIVVIVLFVAGEAIPAFKNINPLRFLTDGSWSPTASEPRFSMLPMIVGTAAATLGSMLLTAPLGVGSALFLRFYAPKIPALLFRKAVEILAGVPSVVYGLFGLSLVVPLLSEFSPLGQGNSLLAGIIILTMMTLPTVIVSADAAIAAVSNEHYHAAAALGLSKRATAWSVILPAARQGIFAGIVLQIGRALGETMAVLMVCGNVVQVPGSLFDPVRTLTANIAMEMGYAQSQHRSILFVSGLLLLVLVAAIMWLVDWSSGSGKRHGSHSIESDA